MPDSQYEPGAYPKRSIPKSAPRNAQYEPSSPARRSSHSSRMDRPAQAPGRHALFGTDRSAPERPVLPHTQESSQAQHERTERLRAMRQDFFDHAQTKITPQKPRNVWLAVMLTGAMLVLCIVGVVAFFQLRTTLFAPGGQDIATQFMDDMKSQNYSAAYSNFASTVQEVSGNGSHPLQGQRDFMQQAQTADKNGKISAYTQTGSNSLDANTMQYTFSVTRSGAKSINPTTVTVNLSVTKQSDGSWKISSIDGALLPQAPLPPAQPTPTGTAMIPGQYPLDLRGSATRPQHNIQHNIYTRMGQ